VTVGLKGNAGIAGGYQNVIGGSASANQSFDNCMLSSALTQEKYLHLHNVTLSRLPVSFDKLGI
jgi:hypothetical protein